MPLFRQEAHTIKQNIVVRPVTITYELLGGGNLPFPFHAFTTGKFFGGIADVLKECSNRVAPGTFDDWTTFATSAYSEPHLGMQTLKLTHEHAHIVISEAVCVEPQSH